MTKYLAIVLTVFAAVSTCAQQNSAPTPAWNRVSAVPQDHGTQIERGAAVFNNLCAICHGKDAKNAPGTLSLQYKYNGKLPAALQDRRDLTPEFVKLCVRKGVATMPFFRKTELNDADLDALAAYLTRSTH